MISLNEKPALAALKLLDRAGVITICSGKISQKSGAYFAIGADHFASIPQSSPIRLEEDDLIELQSPSPDTGLFQYRRKLQLSRKGMPG